VRLEELVKSLPVPPARVVGDLDREVRLLAADSRRVEHGALFFALPGQHTDGSRFVDDAVARGAVAIAAPAPVEAPANVTMIETPAIERAMSAMAAAFYGDPSRDLELVGVTGTNGKTTVTWLLESIWSRSGRRPAIIGTIRYRLGDREWPAPFTTPQAIELQQLLAEMRREGATTVAMEVSSHSLALDRVEDCQWNAAVFTNLTRDHLDFHPDMERYFAAKTKLFVELLPRSAKTDRFAVVNRDDPYGARLLPQIRERTITFGRGADADVAPLEVRHGLDGLAGEIRIGSEHLSFRSGLVGEAHLENILAAAAVAWGEGIPGSTIAEGIAACRGVPGRLQRVDDGRLFAVFVDYAHTPDALERSIRALRGLTEGRLILVFGCGGDRDRGKRRVMGEIAGRLSDVAIITSDNPRTEDPLRIIHEIERGTVEAGLERLNEPDVVRKDANGYVVIEDRRRAIRLAIESARPSDVVLIAGKGHESYQIIGTEKHPFDDREEAQRWIMRGTA